MSIVSEALRNAFVPGFWNSKPLASPYARFQSYSRQWGIALLMLMSVALVPLAVVSSIDFKLTEQSFINELSARLDRVTSNSRRSITFYSEERASALRFIMAEHDFTQLSDSDQISLLLQNLKVGFGGMVDLGVIAPTGEQVAYAGPFNLRGKSYAEQDWFKHFPESDIYVSDVFLGVRNQPHMFIAVRSKNPRNPFILRATLDTKKLIRILDDIEAGGDGEAILINWDGLVQSSSPSHPTVLEPSRIPLPEFSEHTETFEWQDHDGSEYVGAYAYIQGTSFVLIVLKPTWEIMRTWTDLRLQLVGFLLGSILTIVVVVYTVSTYMINKAYQADNQQAEALQKLEDSNRLASIGHLAAGVAHEINNPLAIIEMKAGLIKDLLTMEDLPNRTERLLQQIESMHHSVDRCGRITKQLLGFARQVELDVRNMDITGVIQEVLSFIEKHAAYMNIEVQVDLPPDLPSIRSDRGKLQQVLLNIVTNALQAMPNGGKLTITGNKLDTMLLLSIADTGPGISPEHMQKLFEPFFTTKLAKGGSGLGLSISYGLIKKLGGSIEVHSEPGKGARFDLILPLANNSGESDEDIVGR
ncbi:MAG: two-component sensor histidine kinase [Proteobacteria bacterium]|nr:two-component sensor histidine kinase [Pseudomonadota bacterium]MBU1610418.1 two-component sensor histidine kinase [Pseudomonadota bacterium]